MPLVLLSGYPSSGKTHRAQQLLDFFTARIAAAAPQTPSARLRVVHISDHSLGLARDAYLEARTEKDARAAFAAAVKRALSPEVVVLADAMNYIKGFRYQLYCEAKALHTPSCVVHVGTPIDTCRQINARRLEQAGTEAGYAPHLFDNLVFRYEEPNGMARWDSPLFTVPFDDVLPPLEPIWEAMVGNGLPKTVRPNQATVLAPATDSDYLYILDKTTQDVLAALLDWQRDHPGEGGASVAVTGAADPISLPVTPLALPQLQRLRRQYIALNRQHPLPKLRIRDSFIAYLNDSFT